MQLRQYQQELIDNIKAELLSGKRSICAVLGCGGGKSIIQAAIAKSATDKGNHVLFLVHRKELCEQIKDTFSKMKVNFSLCEFGMVQTIVRRLSRINIPQVIITDEAHHGLSNTYLKIYNYFSSAIRLGFTATPCRMNEGGLGKICDSLVESVSTKWLIKNKYLAPFKYYSVKLADVGALHIKQGDYDSRELAALMEQNAIYGDTVTNYVNIAKGKKTIIYCASIKSSEETAQVFNLAGFSAAHLDGTTSTLLREEIINKFKAGEIKILCNVDLFGEGFDVPDCECSILLRPTKSLTLYIQQSMRCMRYQEDKTAYIIDHVGNIFQHGFPDEPREWTLENKKKKQECGVCVKQCPQCFACLPTSTRICAECGYEFTTEECAEKVFIDTKLEQIKELDALKCKPYNYFKGVKTFDEMVKFQKAKGFKFGWVLHKCLEQNIEIPDKYNYMVRKFFHE